MKIISSIMTQNPCYTSGRKIKVQGLMLHSVGCPQPSAEAFIKSWNNPNYGTACVHGFIDGNSGDIYQTLPWDWRGWHCGGSGNDTHIGIEMCEPGSLKYISGSRFSCYNLPDAQECARRTYNSAVELFAYLCKEYGLNPIKDIVSHKEGYGRGIATNHGDPEHLWYGLNLDYTMSGFRQDVAVKMGLLKEQEEEDKKPKTQVTDLLSYGRKKRIKKLAKLFTDEMKRSGIPASVSCAQAILESGYLESELAKEANNIFGMKASLSGNTWGSVWRGEEYKKLTEEFNPESESFETMMAGFRKYPDIETSITDHAMYLKNAMKGDKKRYGGLVGCTDYRKAAKIIYDGGYATDPGYPEKLTVLIKRYELDKYDVEYEDEFVPFVVKVVIDKLRIRGGAGTDYAWTGRYTGQGTFTIVETRTGQGSSTGWGRLKSGLGWISLDYVTM